MEEKLWRIEIAYFLSSCLWDLKTQGVQKTPLRKTLPRQILPQKVPPCQFPPEENSPMEKSPVSFSQVIFVEKMFLFLKTDFLFTREININIYNLLYFFIVKIGYLSYTFSIDKMHSNKDLDLI